MTFTSARTGRSISPMDKPNWSSWSKTIGTHVTPSDMNDLAKLLQTVPGIKSIDFRDVRRLAALLRDSPEIGSIEIKGWFGTGVVITRTSVLGAAAPAPMVFPGVAVSGT